MKKMILVLAVVMTGLSSFAEGLSEIQQEIFDQNSGCKAVSADLFSTADDLFFEKYKLKYLDIKNPTDAQRKAYDEVYDVATKMLQADINKYCY